MIRLFKIGLVVIFLIITTKFNYKSVSSQENFESILGTINTEPITSYDLSQRIKILLKSLGLEDNVENRDAIRRRTIDLLIEEKIKMLESKKEQIKVTELEVESFLSKVFSFPGSEIDNFKKFLEDDDIDYDIIYEQMKTEITWKKTINKKFAGLIFPNPEKVQEIIEGYYKKRGSKQYNFSEIVIQKKDKNWSEIEKVMKKVYQILEQNSNFQNVASKFSESSSSLNGGNLGWISEKQIDQETKLELEKLERGSFSNIFRFENGYKIVKLNNIGKIGESDDKTFSFVNVSGETQIIKELNRNLKDCDSNYDEIKKNGTQFDLISEVKYNDLSKEIADELENKKIGETTSIMNQGDKSFFLLICDIKGGELNELNPDIVEEKLYKEKLNLMARTLLIKLKKQANINLTIN
ncbi:peptidylprolyl isomerase [Rickettsiales bacterium]|nr:peptidylprolyl isomerase [Rickettsiales bacterium]